MRPRLLDLFCGAGGAAMGYHRAGFDVVGVDIDPQPHYPFEFVQMDAFEALRGVEGFDAIHASPPCQAYSHAVTSRSSKYVHSLGKDEPRLIEDVRIKLQAIGVPYVIENVYGAAPNMMAGLMLCGSMFGLAVQRHRLFESSHYLWSPGEHRCDLQAARDELPLPAHWNGRDGRGRPYGVTGKGRLSGTNEFWRTLMDMPWATGPVRELTEAIPPAYTEWIGTQLLSRMAVTA